MDNEEALLDRLIGPHLGEVWRALGFTDEGIEPDLEAKRRFVQEAIEHWSPRAVARAADVVVREYYRPAQHRRVVAAKMATGMSKSEAINAVAAEARATDTKGLSRAEFYRDDDEHKRRVAAIEKAIDATLGGHKT